MLLLFALAVLGLPGHSPAAAGSTSASAGRARSARGTAHEHRPQPGTRPADGLACPASSCWCHDVFARGDVQLTSDVYYRTAYNKVLKQNQTLFLDVWAVPSLTPRPGAVIIHGGGYSHGPYNGCSHAKNMSSFAVIALTLAARGFAVISIDYRCEGALRSPPMDDNFHPWFDAVEDARAAVRWLVHNASHLSLDTSRIMAFGGSAGAVTVNQLLHALPDNVTSGGNVTAGIALSGATPPASIAAGQVTAGPTSPPYLDLHGTNDTTVPYNWALAHGSNKTWGDAVDTKAWLDSKGAPNYLGPIPGAGHVPFEAVPPCSEPGLYGCWNSTFFGFLFNALDLASVACPFNTAVSDL